MRVVALCTPRFYDAKRGGEVHLHPQRGAPTIRVACCIAGYEDFVANTIAPE